MKARQELQIKEKKVSQKHFISFQRRTWVSSSLGSVSTAFTGASSAAISLVSVDLALLQPNASKSLASPLSTERRESRKREEKYALENNHHEKLEACRPSFAPFLPSKSYAIRYNTPATIHVLIDALDFIDAYMLKLDLVCQECVAKEFLLFRKMNSM